MALFICLVANVAAFFILSYLEANNFISKDWAVRVFAGQIVVLLLSFAVFLRTPSLLWIVSFFNAFSPIYFIYLQRQYRRREFRRLVVSFLDFVVLNLRSGMSLREVLAKATQQFPGIQFQLAELQSLLKFSVSTSIKSSDPLFVGVANDLIEIHQSQHRVIEKMRSLRIRISAELDLTRRIDQAGSQPRFQSIIVCLMFLILLSFTLATQPWVKSERIIEISVALHILGIVLMIQIQRAFKWKT